METPEGLRALDGQRMLAERDLAHGDWGRARRRVADVLGRVQAALGAPEPETRDWMRLLAALARVDRIRRRDGQLSLWPELEDGARDLARSRGPRAPQAAMGVLSRDRRMLGTLALLADLAPTDLPVLVEGEGGTAAAD